MTNIEEKMTQHLNSEFNQSTRHIQLFSKKHLTYEENINLYALFKQATLGDVQGTQPWSLYTDARAKWDAWSKLKTKSRDAAMMEYIAYIKVLGIKYNVQL